MRLIDMDTTIDTSNIVSTYDIIEFKKIIADLIVNEKVLEMKKYYHHAHTTCYEHCIHVSFYNYALAKKLNLNYIAAARAGLLHDLFLYDWKGPRNGRKGLHAFTHPKLAMQNAEKEFNLTKLEKDIILKHMWPTTFFLPKYPESFLCTFTDKYCAIIEFFNGIYDNHALLMKLKPNGIKRLDIIYNFVTL